MRIAKVRGNHNPYVQRACQRERANLHPSDFCQPAPRIAKRRGHDAIFIMRAPAFITLNC